MMEEFTKAERRELRELGSRTYEAEAGRILQELDAEFERWRRGDSLSSDLITAIHEFHQHQARDLWSTYRTLRPPQVVARGVGFGFIEAREVPDTLRAKLQREIDFYEGWSRREDG